MPKLWRIAQGKTRKPVKFGTCCSQVMALFLDIHTPKYKDKREVIWDMAVAMNKELLALRAAGCRCIQIEEPTFHFMANTYGKDHDEVKFMIDAFNREVQGLDDVEIWIHTCWGNPNMQRVMEDTSYANSIEIYLERCRGDVWTLEMKDRNQKDLELFEPFKNDLKKKICIGAVSHRALQADRPEDVAGEIRKALKYIPAESLIVSSDCGFGRQGCNREIAFYKASAIAQGCNIVRRELGLAATRVPAADPVLQIDVVPGRMIGRGGQAAHQDCSSAAQGGILTAQFHQSFQRKADSGEARFDASEGGEILVQPGPELGQVGQRRQLRSGPFRLMMEAHGFDELVREVPARNQPGADLAVIAAQQQVLDVGDRAASVDAGCDRSPASPAAGTVPPRRQYRAPVRAPALPPN